MLLDKYSNFTLIWYFVKFSWPSTAAFLVHCKIFKLFFSLVWFKWYLYYILPIHHHHHHHHHRPIQTTPFLNAMENKNVNCMHQDTNYRNKIQNKKKEKKKTSQGPGHKNEDILRWRETSKEVQVHTHTHVFTCISIWTELNGTIKCKVKVIRHQF